MLISPLTFLTLALTAMPGFGQSLRAAMRLDPDIFSAVQNAEQGLAIALWVVVLAASSEAVGQAVVLLLNRVRPLRFVLAVVIAVLSNIIGYLLWSTVIWLAVWLLFGVQATFVSALAVVGLAYAPQLLAFFEVTPYFGNFFGLLLSLWSMAAIVVAVWAGMGLTLWQAAATGLSSWMVIQLWRRSLGRPIYALGRIIQRRVAGSKLAFSVEDVVEHKLDRQTYSPNWKLWVQQQREAMRTRSARSHARAAEKSRKGGPPNG